jgi:hypothetical protein
MGRQVRYRSAPPEPSVSTVDTTSSASPSSRGRRSVFRSIRCRTPFTRATVSAAAGFGSTSFGRDNRSMSAGGNSTYALDPDGAAYCWSDNSSGQLGNGGGSAPIPLLVAGDHRFSTIAVTTDHACALTLEGEAYCWGENRAGQLGTGNNIDSNEPVAVVSAATERRCASRRPLEAGIGTPRSLRARHDRAHERPAVQGIVGREQRQRPTYEGPLRVEPQQRALRSRPG